MSNNSQITFFTGVGTVTGANFLYEYSSSDNKVIRILIDCGLMQGEKVAMEENHKSFAYDLSSISALIVTHAHLDHVGRIPKLIKDGYTGPIYSTPETKSLAELVLIDAAGILQTEAEQDGVDPLYSLNDVKSVFTNWQTVDYHIEQKISDLVSFMLKDAGHILGSSMIELRVKDKDGKMIKTLFTGDLGNSPAPLLCDTEIVSDANYLIIESAYGDRNHESREGREAKLKKIIDDTIARGGTLVIPAFSIDRTQTLLYELNNMVEQKKIKSIPVFVDSPMAIRATDIYKASSRLFNQNVKAQIENGDDIFSFSHLTYSMSQKESGNIDNIKGPKIILAGSGMSVGGRVIAHEEKYLPDEKSTILLVGYQTVGSLGRQLADGAKKVVIHGNKIKINAKIETIYGYSAHKDSDHLIEFVATGNENLKQVFVVMGEPRASMYLAQRINDELGVKAIMPEREKVYRLD